jgi:WD40 repeat protein
LKKKKKYKIHFKCNQEKKKRKKKKLEKRNKKLKKKKENEEKEENEEEGKKKKQKKIQKIEKYIGSSKCLPTVNGHKGQVYTILGLNSNSYEDCIVSGGFDNLVKIFKTKDSDEVITLTGHEDTVINLTLSESKDFLFSSSYDLTIRKWNLSECSCEQVMEFNKSIQNLLLPMTNDFLLSGGYDGRVKVWNADSINVKTYIYQHGCITTGLLLPAKKECEKNTFVFGDHNGEIFIKQFIIGDENIKNFNKMKKKKENKKNTENTNKKISEKTGGGFKDITEENE